ncbi:MAG: alpha-mannosidase [Phycisphaeraceae bacterium]|nr:MAG: alpha-mannosidase [Phycisphaeraceae bacterium]
MPQHPRTPRHEIEVFRPRFARFLRAVIEPAVYADPTPLEVAAWQTPERGAIDAAQRAEFQPVELGWRWGPAWSTCWFRLRGVMPDTAGCPLDLRFSSGTECTVWIDGKPRRGLDRNRDSIQVSLHSVGGERFEVLIEAACNHPFGVTTFDWDNPEARDRWGSADPGHLLLAELAPRREPVRRLAVVYRFASRLLDELDPTTDHARHLYDALREATILIDDRDVARRADEARARLEAALSRGDPAEALGLVVGHAHIDTAWLWPLAETRRKVVRSWTNALEVLDRCPGASFICSQAQQYAWLEQDAPGVFDRVRNAVAAGRWEPMGGLWVEPDANVPSAESFVRQALHADRYWRRRFGEELGVQRILYLPDSFGFPASIPDLMLACGLDTFITNKIAWCQCHHYPHTNFRWRGMGGGEVLAHFTPNHDYNCTNSPRELIRTGRDRRGHPTNADQPQVFLHPYGFGDGGGGPTLEQAEVVNLAASCEGLPRFRHGTAGEFRERLAALDASLPDGLPVHDEELYLELHRGTLTTHAWLKKSNRELEHALRLAEIAVFAGPERPEPEEANEAAAALDRAWKRLLLQQFHDILPGSSIASVYAEAREHVAEIRGEAARLADRGLSSWARGDGQCAMNPASCERSGVVETGDGLRWADGVPPLGVAPLIGAAPAPPVEVHASSGVMQNGLIEARIDRSGRITMLRQTGGVDLAGGAPFNRLALYRDIPMNWDAWDIDAYAEEELVWTNEQPADSWRVRTADPLRTEIEVVRTIEGRSRITQVFRLDAGSPRLDVLTEYDWNERHRLLRAEMPTGLRAAHATYDIQCGFVERSTGRESSRERMMFEVCAHRWMDLSEPVDAGPGRGLALLNNGRYGHGCRGGTMHLSLLRAPVHPDATAGRDAGSITYSLMPHAGNWRSAGVDHEAEALNAPLFALPYAVDRPWSPIQIEPAKGQRIEIAALKPAHDDAATLVLRLIETRGVGGPARARWHLPVSAVRRADALERSTGPEIRLSDGAAMLDIRGHEIVTLLVDRA